MRYFPFIFILFVSVSLAGCGENEANKANKKAVDSNKSDISLKLAHASESAGDFPAAERYFKEAVNKNSGVDPYFELADFYKRHHGERQALAALNQALQAEPKNTDVLRAIANINIDMGASADALKILDEALAIKSNDPLLYNSKGVALDMLGKYTHARNAYSTAIELDPADSMMFNANLGMSYVMSGNYTKAINLLLPLANMPGSTPQIRQNLSLAYGLKGDNVNAMKYISKDLTDKEAQENSKFYHMLASKQKNSEKADKIPDIVTTIPPIP